MLQIRRCVAFGPHHKNLGYSKTLKKSKLMEQTQVFLEKMHSNSKKSGGDVRRWIFEHNEIFTLAQQYRLLKITYLQGSFYSKFFLAPEDYNENLE